MLTELWILLALVVFNGLFAGAEIAILTASKAKLQRGIGEKNRNALAVEALRQRPERFLATVQIGITVIGAAAGAFGGSTIAEDLAPYLEPALGLSAGKVALVIVVASIAFLSLVLGELVPKSLALRYADRYAFLIGRPLLGLSRVMRPLVWFLTACSNVVLRFFGDRTSFVEARMSRDELREMVVQAAKTGSVDERSGELAARALDMGDVTVAEVMVRREKIVAIPHDATAEEVQRMFLEEGRSRMPVYERDLDRVIGYVTARDVLALAWESNLIAFADIIRPLLFVSLTGRASTVLREMQVKRMQIAIVVDEHGGTAGLVTVEDLVEEIVGDIFGENELPEAELHLEADGSAVVPAWMPTRKVNRALGTALPIARESTTIAGLCMALALLVPPVGTKMSSPDGTMLEIVDASPRRVRTVRIRPSVRPQRGDNDELRA